MLLLTAQVEYSKGILGLEGKYIYIYSRYEEVTIGKE